MTRLLRRCFYSLLVKPLVWVVIGLNVRQRERLPLDGPAIIVANHNSHLDAMVLTTLLPPRLLPRIKPVAAADYFLKNRLLAWFATRIIGILPIARGRGSKKHPLADAFAALEAGDILILFPEGSRGEPEVMQDLKRGIAHIAREFPEVPIVPVYLHGLGKALPKGEAVLVPFFCDVFVGQTLRGADQEDFMEALADAFKDIRAQHEECTG